MCQGLAEGDACRGRLKRVCQGLAGEEKVVYIKGWPKGVRAGLGEESVPEAGWGREGWPRGHDRGWYLIDAELALEAAASPAVEWDLHGVVDMAHLVPTHLILDVQPHHCRGHRE